MSRKEKLDDALAKAKASIPPWHNLEVRRGREFPELDLTEVKYRVWRLDSPYTVEGHRKGLGSVTVPKGFLFDGASIPRIFWVIDSPMGRALRAAVIHDWRYYTQEPDDREFCDDEFYWNMIDSERVSPPRAALLYRGVRLGGWVPWGNRATEIEEDFMGPRFYKPIERTKDRLI